MAKVKTSKKAAPVVEEEEEEEAPVRSKKAIKNSKVVAGKDTTKKAAKASKSEGKASKAAPEKEGYTPQAGSRRDFIMQAMKKGGSADKIRERAAQLAGKAGVGDLATAEAYKGFDILFFANLLKSRGLDVTIDEENGKYKLG